MKIKKQEPKQENDYTALLKPVGTRQTAVEWLIEQIKIKADNVPTNTKENRMVKGVYVDCLIMVKEAKELEKEHLIKFTNDFITLHTYGDYDGIVQKNKTIEQYYNEII